MENYVYELAQQGKIALLENEFERAYPQIKVSANLHFNEKDIIIVICDKYMHFIKAFIANDFDCSEYEEKYLPKQLKELPKSDKYVSEKDVRQFYLRFMKRNFKTYYDDYKSHQLKLIDEDLDTTSV